jgi:hypothetical protein
MFKNYLITAWRNILKNRTVSQHLGKAARLNPVKLLRYE